ncbi:hypothetical protein ACKFKF_12620 [Phormidesmis sp. 146-12]
MSLWDSILAESNAGFTGSTLAFGDPRDVFINSVNRNSLNTQWFFQGAVWRSSYSDQGIYGNTAAGGNGNDYTTAYNEYSSGIDFLFGGAGADTFVAGDQFGPHYFSNNFGLTNPRFAVVTDYNINAVDMVQLSSLGLNGYTSGEINLPGNAIPDAVLYYNNKPIMVFLDTPITSLKFTLG